MRFLTPSECAANFPRTLYLSDDGSLCNRMKLAGNLRHVEGGPPDASRLSHFAEHLIRWLPANTGRLLILKSWTNSIGSPFAALRAMRVGLGEDRDVLAAPGHYFGPHSWTWNQLEMTEEQEADGEILVGLLTLTMSASWDGWLIADDGDAVEFWEGNILFYSSDRERIEAARRVMTTFECRMTMV